jgi:tetratricopeptide (TPR) repeat protein
MTIFYQLNLAAMLINMKNLKNVLCLIIVGMIWAMSPTSGYSQSALRQLENMAGTSINTYNSSSGVDWSEVSRARAEAAAARREAAEQRAHDESIKSNNQGNQAFNNRDWESAVSFYRRAVRLNPSDPVIRQNLQNAKEKLDDQKHNEKLTKEYDRALEVRNKKVEEQRKVFEKNKQPLVKIIQSNIQKHVVPDPAIDAINQVSSTNPSFGGGNMPASIQRIGGLTEQEWSDARAYQRQIDDIYQVWPVPAKDIAQLDALEIKRNDLWKKAISVPGLTSVEREKLKLKLYTEDIYAKVSSTPILSKIQIKGWKMAEQNTVSQDMDNSTASSKSEGAKINSVLKTMLGDMVADKATEIIDEAATDFAKSHLGEKVGPMYGDAIAVTRIILNTSNEGAGAGFSESLELAIDKVKSPRAKMTLEAGKIYLDYSLNAFDKFKEEVKKFNAAMGIKAVDDSE